MVPYLYHKMPDSILAEEQTGQLFSNLQPLEVDPVALDEDIGKKLLAVREGETKRIVSEYRYRT